MSTQLRRNLAVARIIVACVRSFHGPIRVARNAKGLKPRLIDGAGKPVTAEMLDRYLRIVVGVDFGDMGVWRCTPSEYRSAMHHARRLLRTGDVN